MKQLTSQEQDQQTIGHRLPSLSIVFPVYNEFDNIPRCVGEALAAGYQMANKLEIIFVDDASTDGSAELAEQLARQYSGIRVVRHTQNRRLGGALRSGFAAAQHDWILYTDSDLPVKLSDAVPAITVLREADFIIGVRQNRTDGQLRDIMSRVYNKLIRIVFGLQVADVNFAFKLFPRALISQINLQSEGSFIDAELLIAAKRAGCRFAEYPFVYQPRLSGVSTLGSGRVIWQTLREMIAYRCR